MAATAARTILESTSVDRRTAAAIEAAEAAEAASWRDLYAAAPRAWADGAGVGTREVAGALVLSWAATGRRYFNRAVGLGVIEPATEAALDDILSGWERQGITAFLLQSLPECRPAAYRRWLVQRGLEPFDRQERVVRDGRPLALPVASPPTAREIEVERVTRATADEWAAFVERVYRLDTGPWLPNLIGRLGWHQYVAREAGRIVACRGMHIGPHDAAWLGMDGPVPGVTTDDFEPDAALLEFIVADGLTLGARSFLADIEAPSEALDTPAYRTFGRLGFRRPYIRTHHAR